MLQTVNLLLMALLALFHPTARTQCIQHRADVITEYTAATAERYPVPPAILLSVAMHESAFACDPRSGGSLGTPRDRLHRHLAGNSDTNGSALMLGYERCADPNTGASTWLRAISHFRCGRCRCPPLVGYEPIDALNLANRISPVRLQ